MSVMGTRVRRVEDPRFLTTGGVYTADLGATREPRLAGAAWVTFVRSMVAHGVVGSIDTAAAAAAPGVVGVFTADDLTGPDGPVVPGTDPAAPDAAPSPTARPWLAHDRVRHVGETLAVVVTERADQGEDAAEQVFADIDPLPAVIGAEAALANEVLLFPETGTNTVGTFDFGSDPTLFDGCEVVVRERIVNQRVAACPLEVRSASVVWEGDTVTMWVSTQSVHSARKHLCAAFALPESHVRVIAPDVGGGFGAKIDIGPDEIVVAWLARHLDRPMRWVETRSEDMVGLPQGRDQVNHIEIGGRRDGTIEAYRLTVLQDAGAYPLTGAVLPFMTRLMAPGVYDIARVEANTTSVVTTTTVVAAYRGAGRPEATHAVERAVDLFAAEIGLDPAEVRRRNLIAEDAFPFTTKTGSTYDNGAYERSLDLALEAAGYDGLRAEQAARRAAGDPVQLGIGLCVYVEITAGPFPGESEYARVEVGTDGRATVFTGSSSHGMIVADRLGVPMAQVTVVHGDTDQVPEGTGTWGSRSLQVGGTAVLNAADTVVERATSVAAELLEAAVADVVLDRELGRFHVVGTPAVSVTWGQVAAETERLGLSLTESHTFANTTPTFPFGAHVAVVEVDTETGGVTLARIVTVDDAGKVLNPLVVEGQRHGGIAQGVGQALLEEVRFDADGNPVTSNLADYGMISATELPAYELVFMETPTPANPLGAKGIGESGAIGATPAVHNAVIDALSPFGVRHLDLPTTPERVWQALRDAGSAS
jgi:carbon-monoxide dehydrogenase large subunit